MAEKDKFKKKGTESHGANKGGGSSYFRPKNAGSKNPNRDEVGGEGGKKPFTKNNYSNDSSGYKKKGDNDPKKSYGNGDKKDFRPRNEGGKKEFQPRNEGGKKEFKPRNESGKTDFYSKNDGGKKEFQPRNEGGKKEFKPRNESGRTDFNPNNEGGRKAFRTKDEGGKKEFKPRNEGDGQKSGGKFNKGGEGFKRNEAGQTYFSKKGGKKKLFRPNEDEAPEEKRVGRKVSTNEGNKGKKFANKSANKKKKATVEVSIPEYDFSKVNKVKRGEKSKKQHEEQLVRLNRFVANAGVCSRREADDLIANGQIFVNGRAVKEMGFQVKEFDRVEYQGKVLRRERKVYVLLNKPKGYITTTDDPEDRRTVMDLIENACNERIYPVGRLDRATSGVLLFTNDGELATALAHPSGNVKKIYRVELTTDLLPAHFEAIANGIELEDGFIKPDSIAMNEIDNRVVGVEIHSGKNRIVRRIFEHFGYAIDRLDRTSFAGLSKKDIPRGKWRYLKEGELVRLKHFEKF